MSDCVVVHATYGLTDLFLRSLEEAGVSRDSLLCIATQPREARHARQHLPDSQVELVGAPPSRNGVHWRGMGSARVLLDAGLVGPAVIASDRHLRRYRMDIALAFLNDLAERYDSLLAHLQPRLTIGETANASEVLLASLAGKRGIPHVNPATLRVPASRFGLWLGPNSTELWRRTGPPDEDVQQELERFPDEGDGGERPFYYVANNQAPPMTAAVLLELAAVKAQDLLTLRQHAMQNPRLADYALLPWLNRFRKARYAKQVAQREWSDPREAGPEYAFFPLHVQPEASIDWFGEEWRNQIDVTEHLASLLQPQGIRLVVKDHSNFLWTRGRWFHDTLTAIPNVLLVDPLLDSLQLARGATFTFTVSGTLGLECGLRGLPIAVVAPHPWTTLPSVTAVPTRAALAHYIVKSRDLRQVTDSTAIEGWFTEFLGNSFRGLIANRYMYPESLEAANIRAIACAFREFLSSPAPATPPAVGSTA
jgi:hypothetical protein